MTDYSVTTEYISAATNRQSHAADASKASLVAFGASSYVALWDVENDTDRGVSQVLPGHQGLVTCVRFIRDDFFISADDKGVIRCWKHRDSQWRLSASIPAHERSISTLAAYGPFVVTGASDSLVKIYRCTSDDELTEMQAIPMRGRYPLSVALSRLPQSEGYILAIGSTDRDIQIWTHTENEFVRSATLSGHEDWVRSLAFRPITLNDEQLVLASGSQDANIRLWNIEPFTRLKVGPPNGSEDALSDELLDAFEASLGELADAEEGGRQISLKRHILTVKGANGSSQQFTVTFDALLVGHEAGVTSLSWRPSTPAYPEPTLLSTSTDSSLILWSPSTIQGSSVDGATSLWINRQRFGDIGGQRLGGFIAGLWTRHGKEALALGWSGGWRRWRCVSEATSAEGDTGDNPQTEEWSEVGAIGGHNSAVKGLGWSPGGEYLISTGADQTTRIHGPIPAGEQGTPVWHEIARPQVHGYDLVDVAFLDALRFVSIADEKVARVFEASREFVEVVENLKIAQLSANKERPRSATVPPLGLSNKAISEASAANMDINTAYDASRTTRRPYEGELAAITLWPEIEKVFGHGYESIALAVSNKKQFAATACKATSAEHAVVRVYDTNTWHPYGQPLAGHTLTVTRMAFSPDDRFVLSVSRDRSWRLFQSHDSTGYVPVAADKSHTRIIWDCAWAHEGDIFATASRDKTVKIWRVVDRDFSQKWTPETTIKLPEAATAVAFSPEDVDGRRCLAIGLESGEILIYSGERAAPRNWQERLVLHPDVAHVDHVHHLAWRPGANGPTKQLASCSEDGTLKVLVVHTGTE